MRKKQIILFMVSITLIIGMIPLNVSADEHSNSEMQSFADYEIDYSNLVDTISANTAGSIRTVDDIINQQKFIQNTGHGFAFEQGNNQIDRIKGTNARVVGDNNIKNGPDRIILNRDGSSILIQDKCYSTAAESINACFDNVTGLFKYVDGEGKPMQIEVPSDQYDEAILKMREKIIAGKIAGVDNPDEAELYVRKGHYTYKQAKNLTKVLTKESLAYDAKNGVVSAGVAFGIGTLINYTVQRINGVNRLDALKSSAIDGIKSGGLAFGTAIIAGQLSKTGAVNIFKPSSEALTKALGPEFSKKLLNAFGEKVLIEEGASTAESLTKQAAKLLRSQAFVAAVEIVVFSIPDAINVFRGRISKSQFLKNVAVTAASVGCGTVGAWLGGVAGTAIAPGAGNAVGAVVGSVSFGFAGGLVADLIADQIVDDDAVEMYDIIENTFAQLVEDYFLNEEEINQVVDSLNNKLDDTLIKDMYQSENREEFIIGVLEPIVEEVIQNREPIEPLTEVEIRQVLKSELNGVIFIH